MLEFIFANSADPDEMLHFIFANSADPDEMLHSATFHLRLQCFPKYSFNKGLKVIAIICAIGLDPVQ